MEYGPKKKEGSHGLKRPPVNSLRWLKSELIEEGRPGRIPNAVLDKNMNICLVRCHISSDAWLLTDSVVKQKLKNTTLTCLMCFHTKEAICVILVYFGFILDVWA